MIPAVSSSRHGCIEISVEETHTLNLSSELLQTEAQKAELLRQVEGIPFKHIVAKQAHLPESFLIKLLRKVNTVALQTIRFTAETDQSNVAQDTYYTEVANFIGRSPQLTDLELQSFNSDLSRVAAPLLFESMPAHLRSFGCSTLREEDLPKIGPKLSRVETLWAPYFNGDRTKLYPYLQSLKTVSWNFLNLQEERGAYHLRTFMQFANLSTVTAVDLTLNGWGRPDATGRTLELFCDFITRLPFNQMTTFVVRGYLPPAAVLELVLKLADAPHLESLTCHVDQNSLDTLLPALQGKPLKKLSISTGDNAPPTHADALALKPHLAQFAFLQELPEFSIFYLEKGQVFGDEEIIDLNALVLEQGN